MIGAQSLISGVQVGSFTYPCCDTYVLKLGQA